MAGGQAPGPAAPVESVGPYRLGERHDADPGAEAYRATDPGRAPGEREVVVEFFPPLDDAEARRRFGLFRAQFVGLEIPGVAMTLEAGVADGYPYAVRRWIPGETLAATRAGRGAMRPDEAVRMILPVADALAFAHARGLIHGEVTAAHLRVDPGGLIFVEGFGSAALRASVDDPGEMPVVVGDIAGLADILHGLVTGSRRAAGPKGTLPATVASPGRRARSGSWTDLLAILRRAGALHSATRGAGGVQVGYGSMAEFAADLRAWQLGRPLQARPPSVLELLRDWSWMHPFATLGILFGVLTVMALPVGYSWWKTRTHGAVLGQGVTQQRRELDYVSSLQRAHAAVEAGAWERLDTLLAKLPTGIVTGPELGLLRSWLAVQPEDRLALLGVPIRGVLAQPFGSQVLAWHLRGADVLSMDPPWVVGSIRNHGTNPPLAVDFLPDGRRVVLGTSSGVSVLPIQREDASVAPRRLRTETTPQLRVSPGGRWLAATSAGTGAGAKSGDPAVWPVELMSLLDDSVRRPLRLPLAPVIAWAWIEPEPGLARLAVALEGGEAGSWDLVNTNYVTARARNGGRHVAAAWDAAGKVMARLDASGGLDVVNFQTGENLFHRDGQSGTTPLVSVSRDGSRVATLTAGGDVLVTRVPDNASVALLPRRQEEFTALEFVGNNNLVTGSRNGSVWRWKLESATRLPGVVFTNSLPFAAGRPHFSPDLEWVALPESWQDENDRFVVQRLAQPRDPESIPGQPAGFLGPRTLLVWDRASAHWEAWGMSPLQRLGRGRLVENEAWNWVTLSGDASHLLVRGPGDRLELFRTATGQRVSGLNERVDSAAISDDGRHVAVVLADAVGVWSTATGSLRRRPGSNATTAAISADGRWAAFGNDRGQVRLWRLGESPVEEDLAVGPDAVTSLAFTGDDQTLFVATAGGQLQAWSVRVRQELFRHRLGHAADWLVMGPEDAGLLSGHHAPADGEVGASWWWPNADHRAAFKSVREPAPVPLPAWFERGTGRR